MLEITDQERDRLRELFLNQEVADLLFLWFRAHRLQADRQCHRQDLALDALRYQQGYYDATYLLDKLKEEVTKDGAGDETPGGTADTTPDLSKWWRRKSTGDTQAA